MTATGTKDLFAFADDNNRPSIIYLATNKVNGKRYVGLTRLSLEERRDTHFGHARRKKYRRQYFYRAIRKYGEDAFEFSILCRCDTYKEACAAERRYIVELRPEYNLTAGGEGILGHRHSPETRRKMLTIKRGTRGPWAKGQCPPEVRAKLSLSARLRKGREQITGRRRESILENARLGNVARRRPVICLNDGCAHPSATAAANHYGIHHATVEFVCHGKYKSSKAGLRFVYAEEVWLR